MRNKKRDWIDENPRTRMRLESIKEPGAFHHRPTRYGTRVLDIFQSTATKENLQITDIEKAERRGERERIQKWIIALTRYRISERRLIAVTKRGSFLFQPLAGNAGNVYPLRYEPERGHTHKILVFTTGIWLMRDRVRTPALHGQEKLGNVSLLHSLTLREREK